MIHLASSDLIVIFLYFAGVLYVGYRTARKSTPDEEDFLLAGRTLTLPVFVMTLVSTWYGGILGVGEFSYRYGISNWVVQGVPYYIFAAVFAAILAKKIRASNLTSIPDKLQSAYDTKTALFGAFLTFILMTPAPYILMLSVLLQMIFGWNLLLCLVVISIVAISYLYWGGFRSDVGTDVLEFFLMFIGFAVIIPFAFNKYGGMSFLTANLPPLHLTWHGGNSWQFILVWFFIALWTLVDPSFHQRCYAAKSGDVAQKGILISIAFWFLFDAMTATAGLYARAALPGLSDPVMAYPMLAEAVLPPIAKGLFYVGMLATIMSTLNTLAFVSAQTLGRDLWFRWRVKPGRRGLQAADLVPASPGLQAADPEPGSRARDMNVAATKYSLVISFLVSIAIAVYMPSVIRIWYTIGTIIIPGLLVPLMAGYFDGKNMNGNYAFVSMLLGWGTSVTWLVLGYTGGSVGTYPLGIEPMYPGLVVSIAVWGVGRNRVGRTSLSLSRGTDIPVGQSLTDKNVRPTQS